MFALFIMEQANIYKIIIYIIIYNVYVQNLLSTTKTIKQIDTYIGITVKYYILGGGHGHAPPLHNTRKHTIKNANFR